MNDRGLEMVLIALFGGAGLILLVAALVLPYLSSDRVLAVIGASLGLGFAILRSLRLRRSQHRHAPATVDVPTAERR